MPPSPCAASGADGLSRRAALRALGAAAGLAAAGRAGAQTPRQGGQQGSKDGRGAPPAPPTVDLLLVLAVDASGSVSRQRFELQRSGYAAAFRHPRVLRSVRSGILRSIAVTMVQWTGPHLHVTVVPWSRLSDAVSLEAFAAAVETAPRKLFGGGTSISGAIDHAVELFERSPWQASRRVVDVSGDGMNTSGRPASQARDDAVRKGIVVNGLPILAVEFDLDVHYRDEVIGGPGAFMIAAKDFDSFGEAILRKLVAEIAGIAPGGTG